MEGDWCRRLSAIELGLALIAGLALMALYFWQIFITMPHLPVFSPDTPGWYQKDPYRGAAIYYFSQSVLSLWNDFYAIAVVQGIAWGAVGALLGYSMVRATGSYLLGLAALAVCLFKVSLVVLTQELASDSLFATAVVGLLAAALLLSDRPSPPRVALFLLFGFAASIGRSIGAVILWSLVLGLALRLWRNQRRALGTIVAGCIGIYALSGSIGFINYGFWGPHAQVGLALICRAPFIAADSMSSSMPYLRKFVAATAQARAEFEAVPSWAEKFAVYNRYNCNRSWEIGEATLVDGDRSFYQLGCFDRLIVLNDTFKRASFDVILRNPAGYFRISLMDLIIGGQMLSSYGNYALDAYYIEEAERSIARIRHYIDQYGRASQNARNGPLFIDDISTCARPDLLMSLMVRHLDDWLNTPHVPKSDLAKPLRDLFGLVKSDTVNLMFIAESVVVVILVAAAMLRGRQIGDFLLTLFLLVVSVWSYVVAISLIILPMDRYTDSTSAFVYIALIVGSWGFVSACLIGFQRWVKGFAV